LTLPILGHVAAILVAEDNLLNFELLRDVLVAKGHDVKWSRDGVETLAEARTGNFDLVLLDLHMPKLGGIEVLQELRSDPASRTLPVLVVSADAMAEVEKEVMAAGADGYISKPLEVRELAREVERRLQH
jgi:CheY-like chemotaxis protein